MPERILVVDDEPRFLRLVEANLLTEGYEVLQAANGKQDVHTAADEEPDPILLDGVMHELEGVQACERFRELSSVAIIMLTAKGDEEHRVRGLELGADDYIVKPFSANELMARVRAVLRRSQRTGPEFGDTLFERGNLRINFASAEVSNDSEPVQLSATEYRLLLQFARNVGKTLTSEDLLSSVWGPEYSGEKEILWVSISRLRQKLEKNRKRPELILTRAGEGYYMP